MVTSSGAKPPSTRAALNRAATSGVLLPGPATERMAMAFSARSSAWVSAAACWGQGAAVALPASMTDIIAAKAAARIRRLQIRLVW